MFYPSQTMKNLKKTSIRVTDIAMQYWCEKQMELNYIYGPSFKLKETVNAGKEMHEKLEKEISVPIILQPKNYADYLFKDFYKSYTAMESLNKNKKAREISLYGIVDNLKIIGKIDELAMNKESIILIENKTRDTNKIPSEAQTLTNKVQIMIYKKLLNDIIQNKFNYEKFNMIYSLDRMHLTIEFVRQLNALEIDKDLQNLNVIAKKFFEIIAKINNLSNNLYLKYINYNTGEELKVLKFEYDENYANEILAFSMNYWKGKRNAIPVSENEQWKCSFCKFFGDKCKVWYNGVK